MATIAQEPQYGDGLVLNADEPCGGQWLHVGEGDELAE